MKFNSIIACGLLLLGLGATTTSCEDMFTPENKLVSTDLAPADTLYNVMGIVKRMQVLADRTVLLGELRADLVDVDPLHASSYVQELAANNVSDDNIYNKVSDYYDVINNCNIYLANVDSLLKAHGEYYYEREICAVKGFRAWCYLELAKIYGEVPLVTEPVLTSDAAEDIVNNMQKSDMKAILDFCIEDLAKYPYMDEDENLRQVYGNFSYAGFSLNQLVIPVRPLLAELYLWRGACTNNKQDYIDAIRMYHDYFTFPNEEKGLSSSLSKTTSGSYITYSSSSAYWYDGDFDRNNELYTNHFTGSKRYCAGVLALDTVQYYGTVSDIRSIFNSQYSNNYYPAVSPSTRMKSISKNQDYCKFLLYTTGVTNVKYGKHDANEYKDEIEEGDLRLSSVYHTYSNLSQSQYNANFNGTRTYFAKYLGGSYSISTDRNNDFIPYFRIANLYLHMAEALNRAGFPETAFAVLAYGLSYDVMNNRDIISQDEFDRLCEIKSYGFTLEDAAYTGDMIQKTSGSFVIWPSDVFFNIDRTNSDFNNYVRNLGHSTWQVSVGVHSLGSGDTEYNELYYLDDAETKKNLLADIVRPDTLKLPVLKTGSDAEDTLMYNTYKAYNDSVLTAYKQAQHEVDSTNIAYLSSDKVREVRQKHVKQLILDEEALEGAFEGLRFYDLLRYQMSEGKVSGKTSTITLPDYITEKYGKMDTDNMTGKPWYLKLPKR